MVSEPSGDDPLLSAPPEGAIPLRREGALPVEFPSARTWLAVLGMMSSAGATGAFVALSILVDDPVATFGLAVAACGSALTAHALWRAIPDR